MTRRLSMDVRAAVFEAAKEEAEMRGRDRIGSDHLLLALLRDSKGEARRALGIDEEEGRRALEELDASALASVGLLPVPLTPVRGKLRRRTCFTEGAKSALVRSVHLARGQKARTITSRHLVAGLVAADAPDPVVSLLRAAGVDIDEARQALRGVA